MRTGDRRCACYYIIIKAGARFSTVFSLFADVERRYRESAACNGIQLSIGPPIRTSGKRNLAALTSCIARKTYAYHWKIKWHSQCPVMFCGVDHPAVKDIIRFPLGARKSQLQAPYSKRGGVEAMPVRSFRVLSWTPGGSCKHRQSVRCPQTMNYRSQKLGHKRTRIAAATRHLG